MGGERDRGQRRERVVALLLGKHILRDQPQGDFVRREEGEQRHQRLGFGAFRRGLLDGEAEGGEHRGGVGRILRRFGDQFGQLLDIAVEAPIARPAIGPRMRQRQRQAMERVRKPPRSLRVAVAACFMR